MCVNSFVEWLGIVCVLTGKFLLVCLSVELIVIVVGIIAATVKALFNLVKNEKKE